MVVKILLINPPIISTFSHSVSWGEPLGLAYIAGVVEACPRHEVEVLDAMGLATTFPKHPDGTLFGLSVEEILDRLKATSFDAIGITVTKMFDDVKQTINLIRNIKEAFPHIPIIAGGPEVTLEWQTYMELGTVDYLVLGEGEDAIIRLLDFLDGVAPIEDLTGVCYRKNGETIKTAPSPSVDSTNLPWPARHLFPMENYFRFKPPSRYQRVATILTSRACPFNCAFCSTIEVWGRKWRGRPAKDIVDEMEHLIKEYGAEEIHIVDDNFLVDRKRAEEILDLIIERKLNVAFHCVAGLMIWLLSNDLLVKLQKAGWHSIQAQLESGNPKTLEYIDKHIDISKARDLVKFAHPLGLRVVTNVILGFFFEDQSDIDESIRVAESIGFDRVDYILAQPKEGTRMYRDWVEAGLIKDGENVPMPTKTLHFTGPELAKIQSEAQLLNTRNYRKRVFSIKGLFTYLIPMYLLHPGNIWVHVRQKSNVIKKQLRRSLGGAKQVSPAAE